MTYNDPQGSNDEIQELRQKIAELKASHNLFLHKISHDLKTPLNELQAALDTLKVDDQMPPQQTQLQQAKSACSTLDHYIEQILTLDEITNKKVVIHRQPFNLRQVIENYTREAGVRKLEQHPQTVS